MVDRDSHGRTVEGGAISKRGPLNTFGTGVTNSMTSPHRSHKTISKGDWKHHPILVYLSRTRETHREQPPRMPNLSDTAHGSMQYMLSPKMWLHTVQSLKNSMPHMSGDQHLDPRYSGNWHTIGQFTPKRFALCREYHRNGVDPQKSRDGPRGHRLADGPKHSVPNGC